MSSLIERGKDVHEEETSPDGRYIRVRSALFGCFFFDWLFGLILISVLFCFFLPPVLAQARQRRVQNGMAVLRH
jgi:hypothetical protein